MRMGAGARGNRVAPSGRLLLDSVRLGSLKRREPMRKLPLVAGALVLAGMALPGGAAPAGPPIVLKAARVFTATSESHLTPGMVIVEGDHITQVENSLATPQGAQVIDLGDATLLPGFIDAHVHLDMEMGEDWYRDFYQDIM